VGIVEGAEGAARDVHEAATGSRGTPHEFVTTFWDAAPASLELPSAFDGGRVNGS
jgi:hypothetical protein